MKDRIKELLSQALPLVDLDSDFLFGELDSLGITTILMTLQDEFGVTLDHQDVTPRNFKSLDSLVVLIQQKQG